MFRKYPKLFQDPCINYSIDDFGLNFADYITQNKQIISNYRDLNPNEELIIEAAAPFEFRPLSPVFSKKNPTKIKYGALLIHGLLDTPFIMRDIGKDLQSQGLLVRSIILPGHGTVPGSLLNVKYEDWLQAVSYGISSLLKEVEQVFLIGFSTGASLSIYQTLRQPANIAGLILLSPAFKINSTLGFATNWHHTISWAWLRSQWMYITNEIDYTKYSSVPFNAVYQVYRLTNDIKKMNQSKNLTCPLLIILSYHDLIVCKRTTLNYFNRNSNPKNKMILYAHGRNNFNDPRIIVRNSVYSELKIKNFSHISIPISPDNPHYGKQGDFPFASRIEENKNYIYGELNKPQRAFYSLLHKLKLIQKQRRRLTFNPDFDFMMQEMGEFISSV